MRAAGWRLVFTYSLLSWLDYVVSDSMDWRVGNELWMVGLSKKTE